MALEVLKPMEAEMWTSDRRLYLTPDGQVSEQPVSGGTLLVPVGGELPNAEAERYGLLGEKAATAPLANKGRKGKQDKAAEGPEEAAAEE